MDNKVFDPGFDIQTRNEPIGFILGKDTFENGLEIRKLDAIRKSLKDPNCDGPEDVYAIMMDVGNIKDQQDLIDRKLLYGVVCYAKGKLGKEPVRSQGHIHAISKYYGKSTPEIYEIWQGKAIIYMQEYGDDNPGRCYAVIGNPGDVIVVPPGWVHATINADANTNMSFGAWCVRDYGFEYQQVRSHNGIAFFPIYSGDEIVWKENPAYNKSKLIIKKPNDYEELGIKKGVSIYKQYQDNHNLFDFVVNPYLKKEVWEKFIP